MFRWTRWIWTHAFEWDEVAESVLKSPTHNCFYITVAKCVDSLSLGCVFKFLLYTGPVHLKFYSARRATIFCFLMNFRKKRAPRMIENVDFAAMFAEPVWLRRLERTLDTRFESQQCLEIYVHKLVDQKHRLPYWLSRGQQVSQHRWIWEIHCM